jgi:hypothetical protein
MWAAASEMLRRGADVSTVDSHGRSALDVLVECIDSQALGTTRSAILDPRTRSVTEKVEFVKRSNKYVDTGGARRRMLDEFLSACSAAAEDDAGVHAQSSIE